MKDTIAQHSIPLGVGFETWSNHDLPGQVIVMEKVSDLGKWIEFHTDRPDIHGARIRSITYADAEKLCYLLYDITQPLRDAREKALKEQGG